MRIRIMPLTREDSEIRLRCKTPVIIAPDIIDAANMRVGERWKAERKSVSTVHDVTRRIKNAELTMRMMRKDGVY